MQKYDLENGTYNDLKSDIPMSRETYLQALTKVMHPRHKEAMAIRNEKYFAPETMMERHEAMDLDRHITSMHLAQD